MKRLAYILLSTLLSIATSSGIYAQSVKTKKATSSTTQAKISKASNGKKTKEKKSKKTPD